MDPNTPTREVYWNIGHQYLWLMYLMLAVMIAVMAYAVYRYVRLIAPGKPEDRFDQVGVRLRHFFKEGLAQGRTLQKRYAGLSHLMFTVGFFVLFLATTVVFLHEDLGLPIMQGGFYLWFQSLTADLFGLVAIVGVVMAYAVYRYVRLIAPGKPEDRFDQVGVRLRHFFKEGLAQGRTLQKRYAGLSHLMFTVGFFVLFLATTVVFLHEDLGLPIMQGGFYLWFQSLTADLFGLVAIIGVVMALLRRTGRAFGGGRPDRLYHPLDPRTILDDNLILWGLLVILVTGYVIEGIRIVATNDPWGNWSPIGRLTGQALQGLGLNTGALLGLHAFTWWFHLALALAWLAYIPYSKLRHIVFSPANIYFRSLAPRGQLGYIDVEKAFEQEQPEIGIGKIEDLTWKDRFDTQACTECARCELACPASRTGKPLSPMLVILDIRNQLLTQSGPPMARARRERHEGADPALDGERVEPNVDPVRESVPLVPEVITEPVLWDCTTCYACMEACPVFIEHVPKIVNMRRHLVMAENRFEGELGRLFDNLEASGNPWRFPRADRANWAQGLDVPILGQDVQIDEVDVLYWVGCFAAYDERNQKIARALAGLLSQAGVRMAILGTQETCSGDPARRAGHEYLWQMLAGENVATLNGLGLGDGAKTILASCPHCFNTIKDEYPQLGGNFVVRHHAEFLAELVREGKLKPTQSLDASVAYHDPCYLGRYQEIYDQPRAVLDAIPGLERKEIRAGCRNKAMCCGAGGAKIFFEEKRGKRINHLRLEHIQAENPDRVATACPYCMVMFQDAARAKNVFDELPVLDISEYLANSLNGRADGAGEAAARTEPTVPSEGSTPDEGSARTT